MEKLWRFFFAACMATAITASPALSQQAGQDSMMGKGGAGHGMMGKKAAGKGMMRQGTMDEESKAARQGMMGCPMMGGKGHGERHGMMHSRPMMEARLAYIKTDLDITETQTEAWDAYAEAVRARQAAMKNVHADMMKAKKEGTALERIDALIKATETKLDNLKALKPAIEGLYTELTESQKTKADKLLSGGCPMMSG